MSRKPVGTKTVVTVVTLNEALAEMRMGKNTTLAYIISCLQRGHEVHLLDVSKSQALDGQVFSQDETSKIPTICLNDNPELCVALVEAYQHYNNELETIAADQIERHVIGGYSFDDDRQLTSHVVPTLGEFVTNNKGLGAIPTEIKHISSDQVSLVLQRLEPMKGPFPPVGSADFKTALTQLQELFPNRIFSRPNGADIGDKQGPILVDYALKTKGLAGISTPTAECTMDNGLFFEAFESMCSEYKKMFLGNLKVVIKPKDSAQSFGVFALEIAKEGHDLASLRKMTLKDLTNEDFQILKVSPDLSKEDMEEVMLAMLYVQSLKTDEAALKLVGETILEKVAPEELSKTARKLYHGEIQVQPFLEGVSKGDIRVNIAKNEKGDFIHLGSTFRAKLVGSPTQFTTCYTGGKATSAPADLLLSEEEQTSLAESIQLLCGVLNNELREAYKDCGEIGVDFLVNGDGKKVSLGEMNHTCPALVPLSEMLAEADWQARGKSAIYSYGGGLGRTGDFIDAILARQPEREGDVEVGVVTTSPTGGLQCEQLSPKTSLTAHP